MIQNIKESLTKCDFDLLIFASIGAHWSIVCARWDLTGTIDNIVINASLLGAK